MDQKMILKNENNGCHAFPFPISGFISMFDGKHSQRLHGAQEKKQHVIEPATAV